MEKTFIIGDREKNEWVSVFDNNKKQLEFKNHIAEAKTYAERRSAEIDLKLLQRLSLRRRPGLCSRRA